LTDVTDPVPAPSAEALPLVRPNEAEKSYKAHFRLAYAGLALVLAGAAAVVAVVLINPATQHTIAWSRWEPKAGARLDQAAQIAEHVAPEYLLSKGGGQLVAVKASNPAIQNVPVEAIAVRSSSGSDKDIKITEAKNTVVYQLCGLGTRCSIPGKPSVERARLMRREALEIALYTFKYVDGVDAVVAQLPPPPDEKNTNWALFFRKDDFKVQLASPLHQTIADVRNLDPQSLNDAEGERVEKLTRPHWFSSQFQQLQDGNAILVLDPLIASQ
jgi:hypothetical protein